MSEMIPRRPISTTHYSGPFNRTICGINMSGTWVTMPSMSLPPTCSICAAHWKKGGPQCAQVSKERFSEGQADEFIIKMKAAFDKKARKLS